MLIYNIFFLVRGMGTHLNYRDSLCGQKECPRRDGDTLLLSGQGRHFGNLLQKIHIK